VLFSVQLPKEILPCLVSYGARAPQPCLGSHGCTAGRTRGSRRSPSREPRGSPSRSLAPACCRHRGLTVRFPGRRAEQLICPLAAAPAFLLFHFQPWQPHVVQAGKRKTQKKHRVVINSVATRMLPPPVKPQTRRRGWTSPFCS